MSAASLHTPIPTPASPLSLSHASVAPTPAATTQTSLQRFFTPAAAHAAPDSTDGFQTAGRGRGRSRSPPQRTRADSPSRAAAPASSGKDERRAQRSSDFTAPRPLTSRPTPPSAALADDNRFRALDNGPEQDEATSASASRAGLLSSNLGLLAHTASTPTPGGPDDAAALPTPPTNAASSGSSSSSDGAQPTATSSPPAPSAAAAATPITIDSDSDSDEELEDVDDTKYDSDSDTMQNDLPAAAPGTEGQPPAAQAKRTGKRSNVEAATVVVSLGSTTPPVLASAEPKKRKTNKADRALQQAAQEDYHKAAPGADAQQPHSKRPNKTQRAAATAAAAAETAQATAPPAQQPASTAATTLPPPTLYPSTSSPPPPALPPLPPSSPGAAPSSSKPPEQRTTKQQLLINKLEREQAKLAARLLIARAGDSGASSGVAQQQQPAQQQQQQQANPANSSSSSPQPPAAGGPAAGGQGGGANSSGGQKPRVVHSRSDTLLHQLNVPSDRDLTLVIDTPAGGRSQALHSTRLPSKNNSNDYARRYVAHLLGDKEALAIPSPRLHKGLFNFAIDSWAQLDHAIGVETAAERLLPAELDYYSLGHQWRTTAGVEDVRGYLLPSLTASLPDSRCHLAWADHLMPSSYVMSAAKSRTHPGGHRLVLRLSFANAVVKDIIAFLLESYVALANDQPDQACEHDAPSVIPDSFAAAWRATAARSGACRAMQGLAQSAYTPRYDTTAVYGWQIGPSGTPADPTFHHLNEPLGSMQKLREFIGLRAPHCGRFHVQERSGPGFHPLATIQFYHEPQYRNELFLLDGAVSPEHGIHRPLKLTLKQRLPPAMQACSVCGAAGHSGRSCPLLAQLPAINQQAMHDNDAADPSLPPAPPPAQLPRACHNCYSLEPQHSCQTPPEQRHCKLCSQRGHTSFTCGQYRSSWATLEKPAVTRPPNPRPQFIAATLRGCSWSAVAAAGSYNQAAAAAASAPAAQLYSAAHFPPLSSAPGLPPSPPPSTASPPPSPQSSTSSSSPAPLRLCEADRLQITADILSQLQSQQAKQTADAVTQALRLYSQQQDASRAAERAQQEGFNKQMLSMMMDIRMGQQSPAAASYGHSISAAMMSAPSASPAQQLLQPQPQPYPQAPATNSAFATPSASSPSSQPARGFGPETTPQYVYNNTGPGLQFSSVNMQLPPSSSPAHPAGPPPHSSLSAPQSAGLTNAQHQASPPHYQQ